MRLLQNNDSGGTVHRSGKHLGVVAIVVVFGAALVFIWLALWQIGPYFEQTARIQAARASLLSVLANLLDQDASVRGFAAWRDHRDLKAYLADRRSFDGLLRDAGLRASALTEADAQTFPHLYGTYAQWLTSVAKPTVYEQLSREQSSDIRGVGAHLMKSMRSDLSALLSAADRSSSTELRKTEELVGVAAATAILSLLAVMLLALLAEGRREGLDSERRLLAEAVDDLIAVVNYEGFFLWTNFAWQRVLGHMPKELASRPFTDFVYPTDRAPTAYQMLRLSRNERIRGFRNRYRAKDGNYHWLVWNAIPDPKRRLIYVAARDETEHVQAETELAQLSTNDHLTGLPNRRYFIQELNRAITIAQRHQLSFWVLFFDLDGLKEINGRKGHAGGDDALRGVVANIAGKVRESDIFGRVGGDEFGILTPPLSLRRDIEAMAQKIVEAADEKIVVGGETMSVGISMGIAGYPQDGSTANELLACADSAMYTAKRSGGHGWVRYGVPSRGGRGSAPPEALPAE